MLDDTFYIYDEQGNEQAMTILFTFDANDASYVLYYPEGDEDSDIFVSRYDDQGHLYPVTDPEELEMAQEILATFSEEEDDSSQ